MRIVLKISGEALKENNNIDDKCLDKVYQMINDLKEDNELIIIVGGGNFWRGRNDLDIEESISHYAGMLGTVMNSIVLNSYLNKKNIKSKCYSSMTIDGVIQKANFDQVNDDLKVGNIIIFGGGLGIPYLSTDMTTVSKAIEYNADLILMAKNIDGVYDKDPKLGDAKKIDRLTHEELLNISVRNGANSLMIIDFEALASLIKFKIPLYIYGLNDVDNIEEVINGNKGTKIIS